MAESSRPLVAGNWKMNGLRGSSDELAKIIAGSGGIARADLMVCPPATLLMSFAAQAQGTPVGIGAQDCHAEPLGAFTGDLSAEMLKHAQEKIERRGWSHIRLQQMDALNLDFPNEHFDYVMAFHVVSVVPDHQRMLAEVLRVAKPQGTLVIINHFRSEKPWVATLTDVLDPVTRRLGWRTTLRLADLVQAPVPVELRW